MKNPGWLYAFIYEFIGWVCLATFLSVTKRDPVQIMSLPLLWFIAHVISWKTSRAHLNPVVSLANVFRNDVKFDILDFLVYFAAQISGFFVGLLITWLFARSPGRLIIWQNSQGAYQYHEAMVIEFVGTFVFVLVHLLSTHEKTSLSINYVINALVVGTFLGALNYWANDLSGGWFNPIYGFAQNMTDLWDSGEESATKFLYIYVIFPVLGGLAAFPVYNFVMRRAYETLPTCQTRVSKANDECDAVDAE